MAWLSFLQSKDFDPAKFEKELEQLARRITRTERSITRYTSQSRSVKRFLLVYGALGYVLFVVYLLLIHGVEDVTTVQWGVLGGVPLVLTVLIKVATVITTLRIERAEALVAQLKEEHAVKIEELKEKTKFASTQALLNRFADGQDLSAQLDEELAEKQRQLDEMKQQALAQEQQQQAVQKHRGWLDVVVDSVVGDDELSPNNRYALICQQCLTHNGLAPPGKEPQSVKYRCPQCGFVNGFEPPKLEPVSVETPEETPETTTTEPKKDK